MPPPKRQKQRPKVPKTEEQKKAQSIAAATESLQAVASGLYGGIQTRSGKRLAPMQSPLQQQMPQDVEEDKEGTAISVPVEEEEEEEEVEFVDVADSPEVIAEILAQKKRQQPPPPPSPRQLSAPFVSPAQGTLNFSMLIRLYRSANVRTSSSTSTRRC